MEERKQPNIGWEIIVALIVFCVIAVTGILNTSNEQKNIDRIEQLEAQIDRIERTNKQ